MRTLVDKLEYLYDDLEPKKITLIYVLTSVVAILAVVTFVALPIIQSQQKYVEQLQELQTQIQSVKIEQFQAKKAALQKQHLEMQSEFDDVRNDFINTLSKYRSNDFLRFSNANVARFLDTVMKDSLQHNLSIQSVLNAPLEQELFQYAITIQGSGDYADIVSYINGLLKFQALSVLESFDIKLSQENGLEFVLLFHIGGE
jgi:Tfp pilus assembly protein PilE